jgi:hypothetical protein
MPLPALLVPGLAAGAVGGLATGLSTLFGLNAQREAEKRAMIQEGLKGEYQMKRGAIGENLQRQQSALGDLISSYRSTLGGRK